MVTDARTGVSRATSTAKLRIQDCPVCGRGLYASANLIGDLVICPQCKAVLQADEFYNSQRMRHASSATLMDRVNAILDAVACREESEVTVGCGALGVKST